MEGVLVASVSSTERLRTIEIAISKITKMGGRTHIPDKIALKGYIALNPCARRIQTPCWSVQKVLWHLSPLPLFSTGTAPTPGHNTLSHCSYPPYTDTSCQQSLCVSCYSQNNTGPGHPWGRCDARDILSPNLDSPIDTCTVLTIDVTYYNITATPCGPNSRASLKILHGSGERHK